jgi:hypothetical protein
MAQPTTKSWTKLSIWLGDGGSPEDFTSAVCGLTSKTFGISASTSDSEVPDCDDPDAAVWTERVIRALFSQVTGAGTMAQETFDTWRDWMLTGEGKNARIVVGVTPAGYFAGRYVLTNFELTGTLANGKVEVSVTMQSDGEVSWTTGAP